jgi:hypothetical protein
MAEVVRVEVSSPQLAVARPKSEPEKLKRSEVGLVESKRFRGDSIAQIYR